MSKRESLIDIGKGIGSILVIMGHTSSTSYKLRIFIDSFHMPFFFILSGMVLNTNYSIFQFIKRKIKSLLINYYILNFILLIWKEIINDPLKCFKNKKKYINFIKQIFWCAPPYYYYNWFIMSLFTTEVLFFIIYKILHNIIKIITKKLFNIQNSKYFNLIAYFFSLFLLFLLLKYGFYISLINVKKYKRRYYFCLDLIPLNSFFLLIGYYFKNNKKLLTFITKWYFGIFYFYINYFYNKKKKQKYSYLLSENKNFMNFSITSITGSLFLLCICHYIKKNKLLEYIGKNSIIFYAFHSKISLNFFEKLNKSFGDLSNNFKTPIFRFLFVNIGTIIHLSYLSYIINSSFPYVLNITDLISKFDFKIYLDSKEKKN